MILFEKIGYAIGRISGKFKNPVCNAITDFFTSTGRSAVYQTQYLNKKYAKESSLSVADKLENELDREFFIGIYDNDYLYENRN